MRSIDAQILSRVQDLGPGAVFVPGQFLDLGSRPAVDTCLHRLAKKGVIRRIARGVYDYPKSDPELGILLPATEVVAQAVAHGQGLRLQPSGAYAANLLRLSDQVPAQTAFLTDGPSRRIRLEGRDIIFKRTTPRNMATAGRISGLVIQALRHLGRRQVTPDRLEPLRRTLSEEDRKTLLKDLRFAPVWMHPFLRQLGA